MRLLQTVILTLLVTMLWGTMANADMSWGYNEKFIVHPDECLKAQREGHVLWEEQTTTLSFGFYRLGKFLYQQEFNFYPDYKSLICYRQTKN